MPNDTQISLQTCLSSLEQWENELENAVFSTLYKDHLNLLQCIKTLLSNRVEISPTDADRVLIICLRYMTDVRCVLDVFSIISELIDIDRDNPHVDFLPFGLAILKFLNTKCLEDNTHKLRILSVKLLLKHPRSTLHTLIRYHSEDVIKTFQPIIGVNQADLPSKIEAFKLLTMLEWLPTPEKRLFVEVGISLWLADVIPAIMQILNSDEDVQIEVCLTYTEMLAKELVHLDYYENPHYKTLLECTANPMKFPATIMGLLQNGKDNWHRIVILLIKILKSQVTRSSGVFSSPINSLLPILEAAFKKESAQKVRAFACWNELIESFYIETGNNLKKRIKLIMIPLKFVAKSKETVVAKFHTWWHFVNKFRPKINDQMNEQDKEKFTNDIIISFLHFMFAKPQVENQCETTQVSDLMRKRCIEAFADIMNLEQLDGQITAKILLDNWKEFKNALKSCIWAVAKSYTEGTKKQIQCIWISFLTRLAAMADNTVRRDMFDSLINMVSELILENENIGNEYLMEELVYDITLQLWSDNKLKTLITSRSQSYRPMHRIVKLIMDDKFTPFFKRLNSEEHTKLLQPIIDTILEESISTPEYMIWLLDELLVTNNTLVMWTALAQASKETELSMEAFNKILLWPFKTVNISFEIVVSNLQVAQVIHINTSRKRPQDAGCIAPLLYGKDDALRQILTTSRVKEAAEAWYTLYNIINEDLEKTNFYNEISKVMKRPVEDSKASNHFVLFALIGVLEHKPDLAKMEKLEALTYEMNGYNDFEQLLTPLVKSIVLIINNSTDENLAHITINCVENMLKGIQSKTEAMSSKSPVQNRTMLSDTITSTLKIYFEKCPYQSIKNKVKSLITLYDKKTESPKEVSESPKNVTKSPANTPSGRDITPKELASPNILKLKQIKKVARIVAKVVDNGEEYAVIKSNWKFNPKTLTENQKEKLQRKKADIPALYADQSQSQEFNLASWKTDSQDTSMSSSKSDTSNDVANTLKKITNSNIVPKIMENILDIEKNSKPETDSNVSPITKVKTPKAVKLSTPGDKSPRMTLKDRVCRNVRNLIGNSSPSPQDKVSDKQDDTNTHQNVSKSPLSQPEIIIIESPAANADSNENDLKPSNDDVSATDKQENRSPVSPMRKLIVSTQRIDQMMRLARTPVSNTQKEISLQLPAPQKSSVERPARMKKAPKKFDDTLVLPVKKRQYGKNDSESYSEDLLERHTETFIAQIHNPNDKMDVTDANSLQKVSFDEADTNENAKKSPSSTCTVENVTSFAASDDKSHKDTEKSSLISSKTSISKPNAKSPVKSPKICRKTNVQNEISANDQNAAVDTPVTAAKDLYHPKLSGKTSVLLNDTAKHAEKVELVSTPINKTKEDLYASPLSKSQALQKTPKKGSTENDIIPDHIDTPNKSLKIFRKSKVQKEICANDENAAVNTPVTAAEDLCQPKLSAKSCLLLNDSNTNAEKVEVVATPIHKTKEDSDTRQLPLSKSKDLQKTPKKVSTHHDKIPDHTDTPISLRKLRKSLVQKEISANDENAAVNTLVTAAEDLYQPKLSAKTSVLLNDTNTNAEKVEVVSTPINKTKKDSDTSQLPLSKSQDLQKTPKKVSTQHDKIPDHMDTPMSLRKLRKSKVHKEISANNENVAVNTPVTAAEDLYHPKLSAKTSVLLNDTNTNAEKVEVVSTPINKTKKDSDTSQLPSSKSQDLQKTPKKVSTQHDKIPDHMYTPMRKLRNSKVQKEISSNDENTALNTPVTADEGLTQPKLSAQKRRIQNDTDMNDENVEVVPKSIKKTKKDSSLLKSAALSNIVKTKEATQDKLTLNKAYDVETERNKNEENLLMTPKTKNKKKLRIEKELAIDMVEGHPFLTTQSAKRLTRKKLMEVENGSKRKTLIDKRKKTKLELTPKTSKKDKKPLPLVNSTIIVEDSQYKAQSVSPQNITDEPPCSEDVIESSQDSTMTNISVKAKMRTLRIPVVALQMINVPIALTQDLLQKTDKESHESTDIELPQNKSVESDKNVINNTESMDTETIEDSISTIDLTENMDTETLSANEKGDPISLKVSNNTTDLTENMDTETISVNETDDPIILSETLPTPMTVNSESELVIGSETQELAEADTQPNDPKQFETWEINLTLLGSDSHPPESLTIEDNDITQSLPEAALILSNIGDTTEVSSPFKDDNQRKQDFLNNTVEISPIKVQSPDRQKKSTSPETSTDFVVIQLSTPVQGNGEPFDKQCSPEFFTDENFSPDKQNVSPPRVEETVTNSSPSASLSLKKNRPQVNRPSSGRAAQMLASLSSQKIKRPASRAVFNFKFSGNDCSVEENAGTEENFLQLQRSLPTVTSSPSGPILKRKLDEITEDTTASPASKRKRVSFHDPPVSTTVSIQKYLEPISLMRSPQTSTKKRQTRTGVKSPKKLANAFLDSALSKTVESFTEATTSSDETENISLDVTPVAEIVKTSELNDTDPICPGLIDCADPIDVVAIELSSAAVRDSFVKDLAGKVDTVGDLAKMTELEVNRLSIKAPKITVAKKVLTDYLTNIKAHKITEAKKGFRDDFTNRPANASTAIAQIEEVFNEPMTAESLLHENKIDVEMQTDDVEVSTKQTQVDVDQVTSETQTDVLSVNTSVQTVEPYYNEEAIKKMLSDPLVFEKIKEALTQNQVTEIAELLPEKSLIRLLMKIMHESIPKLLYRIIKRQSRCFSESGEPCGKLAPIRDMLIEKFDIDDLGPLIAAIMASKFPS